MSQTTVSYRPLFLDPYSGLIKGVPSGGIIDIGGIASTNFTVGGKAILFADGTTSGNSDGSVLASLQSSYNSSNSPATISLVTDKHFIIQNESDQLFFKVDANTGAVTIGGDLIVSGTHTTINSVTYDSDHIRLHAQSTSNPALLIAPDANELSPAADLLFISEIPGYDTAAFKVDYLGNTTARVLYVETDLTVSGKINNIDLNQFYSNFLQHLNVSSNKHLAKEINIDQNSFLNLPSTYSRNVQGILEFFGESINSIDAQILDLHQDIDSVQQQVDTLVRNEATDPVGFTFVTDSAIDEWVIQHNKNSKNFIFMVFDENGMMILPGAAQITENELVIKFGEPQAGRVNMVFYTVN